MCNVQEKGSENKSKKKWKLWKASSEGSMKKVAVAAVPDSSLTYAVAVMVPRDFKLIKQEWAAIRIQAVFRAFLVYLMLIVHCSCFQSTNL